MKKAAIIHGTKSSPQGNWFQDVASQLAKHDFQSFVPQFPTPDGQSLDNWFAYFGAIVGELDSESIIIGHSVGAVFALRLLERLDAPIAAVVLVAGFTGELGLPEYDKLNSSFVAGAFDWKKIRSNAAQFICMSGDNDPYVPFQQGKEIADSLGVDHLVIESGGHLNAEFGYTKFPQLIDLLTKVGVFGQHNGQI